MSPLPSQPRRPLGLAVAGLLALALAAAAYYMTRPAQGGLDAMSAPARAVADPGWPESAVAGLKLQAPFALAAGEDITASLPEAVREMVEKSEAFEGKDDASGLRVTVLRVQYKPGITLSLDGAARQQVTSAAAALGDTDPDYKIVATEISGVTARRTDYHHSRLGGHEYMSCLIALRRAELWQVQTYYTNSKSTETANRVLQSAVLVEAPATPR